MNILMKGLLMAEPIYLEIIKQFRREVDVKSAKSVNDLVAGWRDIIEAILPDMVKLAERVWKRRDDFSETELVEMRQYERLLARLNVLLTEYNVEYSIPLTEEQQRLFSFLGLEHSADLVKAGNTRRAVGLSFGRASEEAIKNLIAISRAGQPLRRLFDKAYPNAAVGLTRQLLIGLGRGISPRDTAELMMKEGIGQGFNHILLVARDQQIRAYRNANQYNFQRLNVGSYRRVAAHNDRTCAACLALDGEIFKSDVLMPLHPQDRCAMVPMVGDLRGKPGEGEAWFKTQARDVQEKILGKGRLALWEEGGFDFKQLVSVRNHKIWGPSARVTSLKDLKRGRGGVNKDRLTKFEF